MNEDTEARIDATYQIVMYAPVIRRIGLVLKIRLPKEDEGEECS